MDEKLVELGIGKYQKNMKNKVHILMEKRSSKLAIGYAKRTLKEGERKTPAEITPEKKVYELVEKLAKYLLEKVKEDFLNSFQK